MHGSSRIAVFTLSMAALVYVMYISTTLSARRETPEMIRKKEELMTMARRLTQWETKLRSWETSLEAKKGQPPPIPPPATSLDIPAAAPPVNLPADSTKGANPTEADNFEEKPAAPLVGEVQPAQSLQGTPGNGLPPIYTTVASERIVQRFPLRSQTLAKWASKLPLYSPAPRCARGPPLLPRTRLTRHFSVDIPAPELELLQRALCVVTFNQKVAFSEALTMFSFRYLPYILIVDAYGNILCSRTFDYLTTLVAPKFVNSTTVSAIQKRYGEAPAGWVAQTVPILWNLETGAYVEVRFRPEGFLHHDMDFSPVTNTFLALHRAVDRRKNSPSHLVLFDDIYEIDLKGRAVWHWSGAEKIPFVAGEWIAKGKHPDSDCVDFRVSWCRDHMHGNTVFWDQAEQAIYYNAKHTDSFWRIDKATGNISWAVGRYGNFTLLDTRGVRRAALFYKAHGLERIGPGLFLLFDNVYKDPQGPASAPEVSRWVEIEVDPVRKVAQEKRFWAAPRPRFAHQMGDADRMPNGNTLMSMTSTDQLTEATPDGQIAWELTFPAPPFGRGGKWWIFHVERFLPTPLIRVEKSELQFHSRDSPARFTVTVWNTVRVRYRTPGTMEVLHKGQAIHRAGFQFEINWMPTPVGLAVPLGQLSCGPNHLTIRCTNADDISSDLTILLTLQC
eukprot:RCo020963